MTVMHGQVGPGVTDLLLVQTAATTAGRYSRFGAWVVCTEQPSPFQVIALHENGSDLGRLDGSIPPEDPFYFPRDRSQPVTHGPTGIRGAVAGDLDGIPGARLSPAGARAGAGSARSTR